MAAFMLQWQSSAGTTETMAFKNLKYILSGPTQKTCSSPARGTVILQFFPKPFFLFYKVSLIIPSWNILTFTTQASQRTAVCVAPRSNLESPDERPTGSGRPTSTGGKAMAMSGQVLSKDDAQRGKNRDCASHRHTPRADTLWVVYPLGCFPVLDASKNTLRNIFSPNPDTLVSQQL